MLVVMVVRRFLTLFPEGVLEDRVAFYLFKGHSKKYPYSTLSRVESVASAGVSIYSLFFLVARQREREEKRGKINIYKNRHFGI